MAGLAASSTSTCIIPSIRLQQAHRDNPSLATTLIKSFPVDRLTIWTTALPAPRPTQLRRERRLTAAPAPPDTHALSSCDRGGARAKRAQADPAERAAALQVLGRRQAHRQLRPHWRQPPRCSLCTAVSKVIAMLQHAPSTYNVLDCAVCRAAARPCLQWSSSLHLACVESSQAAAHAMHCCSLPQPGKRTSTQRD